MTHDDDTGREPAALDPDDDAPNVTEPHASLTPRQRLAVEVLAAGGSTMAAGNAAGVRRETVSRWLADVPGFRTTVNRATRDLAARQRARLLALHDRALDVVGEGLDSDDADRRDRAAALVLKSAPLADLVAEVDGLDEVVVELAAQTDDAGATIAARIRARTARNA